MKTLAQSLENKSILVVEDQKFLRSILAEILRSFGAFAVHTAENGEEGKEQFKTWMPDIVITDLQMQPTDGLSFTRWVRRSEDSPNREVPIIVLTAHNDQATVLAARDAGANELIIKPLIPEQVYRRLQAVLQEPRKLVRSPKYVGPDRRRRKVENYTGRLRRLTDPLQIEEDLPEANELKDEISIETEALLAFANRLDVNNRRHVMRIYDRTAEAGQLAMQANDGNLLDATHSLTGYIEQMGNSGRLDPLVIIKHLEAILSLVHLGGEDHEARADVVDSLQELVKQRMRRAS